MKTGFDFGFSIVDEAELKQKENELAQQLVEVSQVAAQTEQAKQEKLLQLRDMVMVLLTGLLAEPQKSYIFWPKRVEKINAFIKEIHKVVG